MPSLGYAGFDCGSLGLAVELFGQGSQLRMRTLLILFAQVLRAACTTASMPSALHLSTTCCCQRWLVCGLLIPLASS